MAAFQLLRHRRNEPTAFLYAFDLLELNGMDLRREPIEVRKTTLARHPSQCPLPACVRMRHATFGEDRKDQLNIAWPRRPYREHLLSPWSNGRETWFSGFALNSVDRRSHLYLLTGATSAVSFAASRGQLAHLLEFGV